MTVLNTRFLSQLIKNVRTRRRIDSSSIIAHPIYRGRGRENIMQELDI